MTINELISGNIYSSNNGEGVYIFRSDGHNRYKSRLATPNHFFTNDSFGLGSHIEKNLRLPTQEEILQLETCEKTGKYKTVKIIHYEIY